MPEIHLELGQVLYLGPPLPDLTKAVPVSRLDLDDPARPRQGIIHMPLKASVKLGHDPHPRPLSRLWER
jgi:hypothetical protein